jgi:hypothetical protein
MKKVILILIAIIGFGFLANAQDLILKKDGSEIKVKVLEITDQEVKYKDFDFQSGPTRNINISEVFMITYENGKKEVFNKQTSTPSSQKESREVLSGDLKREFYRIGTNDSEMLSFFKRNNFGKYYNDFESAYRMRKSGATLLGVGLGITGAGVIWMAMGIGTSDLGWMSAGYAFLAAGEIMIIISIPISAVAGAKKRVIKNEFEREYFGSSSYIYQPTLNLGYTGNGIGISLKF